MANKIYCDRCGCEIEDRCDKTNMTFFEVNGSSGYELCPICTSLIKYSVENFSDETEELDDLRLAHMQYMNLRKLFSKIKLKTVGFINLSKSEQSICDLDKDTAEHIIKTFETLENDNKAWMKVSICLGSALVIAFVLLVCGAVGAV